MKSLYRLLLWFYPPSYRETFSTEMFVTFGSILRTRRGAVSHASFALREFGGLIRGAAREWCRPLIDDRRRTAAEAIESEPRDIIAARRAVDAITACMVDAIATHQFERARKYSLLERAARQKLDRLLEAQDAAT